MSLVTKYRSGPMLLTQLQRNTPNEFGRSSPKARQYADGKTLAMERISSFPCVECKRCHFARSASRIVQPCVTWATECEAFTTVFTFKTITSLFVLMIAALSRFVGHDRSVLAHAPSLSKQSINRIRSALRATQTLKSNSEKGGYGACARSRS